MYWFTSLIKNYDEFFWIMLNKKIKVTKVCDEDIWHGSEMLNVIGTAFMVFTINWILLIAGDRIVLFLPKTQFLYKNYSWRSKEKTKMFKIIINYKFFVPITKQNYKSQILTC